MHTVKHDKLLLWTSLGILIPSAPIFAQGKLDNPINAKSFPELLENITRGLIPLALTLATAAIIWAGFKFITASSSGDTSKIKEARTTLTWILVGTAVVVGAYALASAIVNFAKDL